MYGYDRETKLERLQTWFEDNVWIYFTYWPYLGWIATVLLILVLGGLMIWQPWNRNQPEEAGSTNWIERTGQVVWVVDTDHIGWNGRIWVLATPTPLAPVVATVVPPVTTAPNVGATLSALRTAVPALTQPPLAGTESGYVLDYSGPATFVKVAEYEETAALITIVDENGAEITVLADLYNCGRSPAELIAFFKAEHQGVLYLSVYQDFGLNYADYVSPDPVDPGRVVRDIFSCGQIIAVPTSSP